MPSLRTQIPNLFGIGIFYHRGSHTGGYRVGYRGNYGVQYPRPGRQLGAAAAGPRLWPELASVIYGYPYGTPCYQYNDRDWDYEWVC